MSTLPDLMDVYCDLADHAPTVADLQLSTPPTPPVRRGTTMRAVLATLIAVVAVVALVVYLRSHVFDKPAPPAEVSHPSWPDSYSFGPQSLPGYRLERTDTRIPPGASAALTNYSYTNAKHTNLHASLALVPASKLGRDRDGTPVRVNGRIGYYQAGSSSPPPLEPPPSTSARGAPAATGSRSSAPPSLPPLTTEIAWPISKDSWAVLTVGVFELSYVNGKLKNPGVSMPTQAATVSLAESVRLHESATVAPVKVGYLPANLKLSGVDQVVDDTLGEPNAPPPIATTFDNRFGRSYRDLMFVDRSVKPQCPGQGGRGSCPDAYMYQTFTLDIGVLAAPHTPLELKDLPDARTFSGRSWTPRPYNPANQWTQTTIAGHRAFVSAHDVIVDWQGVEVHVTNGNFPFAVKPVLSQRELIWVAASLTVPRSATLGNGYPLNQAVPAANLH
jgi:hypothetical protein